MLFHPANLPYWIFLTLGILLFALVIFAGGGDEDLDVDADVDIELEGGLVEIDPDLDSDGDSQSLQILGWLGFGKAPLILLLAIDFSTWGVSGWMLNVILGNITGKIPFRWLGLGGIIFLISLGLSLSIGSLMARPLGKLFVSFGEDASGERLIGCVGNVTTKKLPHLITGKIGQVDVIDSAGNLVTISASLPEWATVIPHNRQEVLIIDRRQHSYIVIAKDSSDEDKWLTESNPY